MTAQLTRSSFLPEGIFGQVILPSGVTLKTLEHSYGNRPKLPPGTYTCRRGMHRLHSSPAFFETFEITGVPGHTGVLFHIGNWNADSDGCVLLGLSEVDDMLHDSGKAFGHFLAEFARVDTFDLTVIDAL